MTYLLDTHVFFWLVDESTRIPQKIRDQISDPRQHLLVSSVSAMEVATKVGLGKWDEARPLLTVWMDRVWDIGAEDISMTTPHGILAGSLDWPHRDPFDRMLAGQAMAANLTLVTADKAFRTLPGLKLLTW
jgi:PIN domain nuclease of toxin-antitoxin system